MLDTSAVVDHTGTNVISLNDKLLTPVPDFVRWGAGNQCAGHTAISCSESHSAVPVPGRRPFDLSTDEVYGTFTVPSFGWPWGWMRLINIGNPAKPKLQGEYKILENTPPFQGSPGDPATEQFTSYSSHNPTVLPRLALLTWHSGGLQAIDISNPRMPRQGGWFSPQPLSSVATGPGAERWAQQGHHVELLHHP